MTIAIQIFVCVLFFASFVCGETLTENAAGLFKSNARSKTKNLRARAQVFDDFFNVYDPTFLALVWPKLKNGVHLNIEPQCWDHLSRFYKDLLDGKPWAYTVVDSSGRYEAGVFEGNRFWTGSKHECFNLDKTYSKDKNQSSQTLRDKEIPQSVFRKEKYFDSSPEGDWHNAAQTNELTEQLKVNSISPFSLSFSTVKVALNITKLAMVKSYDITMGMCFPKTCRSTDIQAIFDFSIMVTDHLRNNKTVPRSVQVTSVRTVEENYAVQDDAVALVLIFFTISLIVVALIATAVDYELIRLRSKQFRTMSFDIQKIDPNSSLRATEANNSYNNTIEVHKKRPYKVPEVVMPKKENETLTINNINNSNLNLVTVKKLMKIDKKAPAATVDVAAADDMNQHSCIRCGKYRKQCGVSPRKLDNLPACPRMKYNNSFGSLSTEPMIKCKRNDFFKTILQCFSLRYSWRRICNRNLTNRNLSAIHGLKVISTFWMIFVHVTLTVFYVSENGDDVNKRSTTYNILATGTLAFDTLFFVSGILSSYHFFYLKSRYTIEELVSFGGRFGHILQFICFVSNRAVRLLPPYAYTIFLGSVLARVSHRTSLFDLPDGDHTTCDRFWWRNLLYINNFYKEEEQCLQISWFLSLETQLHALGTLLLCFAPGRGCAGALAICVAMATVAADVIAAWRDRMLVWTGSYAAYATLVERPWARVTPYFIGVMTGWLVNKLEGKLMISRFKSTCLWTISLIIFPAVLTRPFFAFHLGVFDGALSAVAHGLWTAALTWPVLVLTSKCSKFSRRLFDNSPVAALSRLSYGMLLLNGILARHLLLSVESAVSMDATSLWSYYTGTTVLTIAGSFLLSLLVETPCCSLLRRLSDCANVNT